MVLNICQIINNTAYIYNLINSENHNDDYLIHPYTTRYADSWVPWKDKDDAKYILIRQEPSSVDDLCTFQESYESNNNLSNDDDSEHCITNFDKRSNSSRYQEDFNSSSHANFESTPNSNNDISTVTLKLFDYQYHLVCTLYPSRSVVRQRVNSNKDFCICIYDKKFTFVCKNGEFLPGVPSFDVTY